MCLYLFTSRVWFACVKHADVVSILLINVKIPTIVGLCPVVQLVARLTAF